MADEGVIPLDWIRHQARAASYANDGSRDRDDRVTIAVTGRWYSGRPSSRARTHHSRLFLLIFHENIPARWICEREQKISLPSTLSSLCLATWGLKRYAGLSRRQLGQCQERRCFRKLCESLRDTRWRLSRYREITFICVQAKGLCFHKH